MIESNEAQDLVENYSVCGDVHLGNETATLIPLRGGGLRYNNQCQRNQRDSYAASP
ncbi:hypothetical protein OPS25_13545 [Alteromonas ponticola]|uniref:Uncharacterized protein n=1 Tax=Alteromonas aquimaris TaxID=2998417 RepID=A0ABT3P9U0_9ALTE|nr:hypothetical protein [Alteromonas aquimaris]MCW8109529.1 hypothetical protein [Alteromonas aquimaris]